MHWYDPDVATANAAVATCNADPLTFPSSAMAVHRLLYGSLDGFKSPSGVACPPFSGSATAAQLTAADFSDWTLVTLRTPAAGESVTRARAVDSARRIFHDTGILCQLADQHQQPNARHLESELDRRARRASRRH
jgi:hypothetical protein